jgi:TPP-dependent pyruvate/acetoin dehydrogenase alpha subunit
MVNKEDLIKFEEDIAKCFNFKQIKSPIHLYDGNEDYMMRVFKSINNDDWVCCTWRNHYQCLLKGVPSKLLKEKILSGKSMVMNLKDYNIVCSSIVGGIPSIATGIAMGLKIQKKSNRVWCWVGDMSSSTGAFNEAHRYSLAHDLPITFIIEDNGKSVETPTSELWNNMYPSYHYKTLNSADGYIDDFKNKIIYYKYENKKYPHAGAGVRVQF